MLSGSEIWRWIFWGLNFRPGSFLGFGFYPHSIIPVTWSPPPPPPPREQGEGLTNETLSVARLYFIRKPGGWGGGGGPSPPQFLDTLTAWSSLSIHFHTWMTHLFPTHTFLRLQRWEVVVCHVTHLVDIREERVTNLVLSQRYNRQWFNLQDRKKLSKHNLSFPLQNPYHGWVFCHVIYTFYHMTECPDRLRRAHN